MRKIFRAIPGRKPWMIDLMKWLHDKDNAVNKYIYLYIFKVIQSQTKRW